MTYRELQKLLKAYRDERKMEILQGFRLNQSTVMLQEKYLEVINYDRAAIGQPPYTFAEFFPPKPVAVKTLSDMEIVKGRFHREIGEKLTNKEIKEYYEGIQFRHIPAPDNFVFDLRTLQTWEYISIYIPKIKLAHKMAKNPEDFKPKNIVENVKMNYKFYSDINKKQA